MPLKALWFGTGGHESLAAFYHPDKKENPIDFWLKWCESERIRIRKLVRDELPWEWENEYEELRDMGAIVLDHYMQWAPTGDGNYGDDRFTVVGVEMEFEVPVLDPFGKPMFAYDRDGNLCPVVYQGRADGLLRDHYGRLWLFEHKFYHPNQFSQGSQQDHLILDEQCTSYAWGLGRQLGQPIEGIVFNMIKKKAPTLAEALKTGGLQQRANIDSTWPYYRKQLLDYYGAMNQPVPWLQYAKMKDILKAKSGLDNPFFRRLAVRRNRNELEMAGLRVWAQAQEMCGGERYVVPTPDPQKCKFCFFKSACVATLDGADPESILNARFQQRPDPRDKGQSTAWDDISWSVG
jgi:hypothetical protein